MTETINIRSSPKAKRAISFSPEVIVIPAVHLNNYSCKEIRACWYRAAELKRIQEEVYYTLGLIEENVEINESLHCKRGLECFTQEGSRGRTQNKRKGWSAVFEEQELQYLQEVVDPEMIALLYSKVTCHCQTAASSSMGVIEDERAARSHYAFPPGKQPTTKKTSDQLVGSPPISRTIVLLAPRRFSPMA
jgi:hypothetical protein